MSTSPSQKLGTAWAATASDTAMRSIALFGRSAEAIPSGMATRMVTARAENASTRVTGAWLRTSVSTGCRRR